MHIMEGFLPAAHAAGWTVASAPFVANGIRAVRKKLQDNPEARLLLAAAGAFAFLLSALKLPSITGSSSHATGVGLGTVLFGPAAMALLGTIVLLFQALLLAHGGLTTLGANAFSMAVAGPLIVWAIYRAGCRVDLPRSWSIFLAAALGDLATFTVTSTQLALAFPDAGSGFPGAFAKFAGVFAITQVPLALGEGILTVLLYNALAAYTDPDLHLLGPIRKDTA